MYAFNAATLLALVGAAAAKPTMSPAPMPTGSKNGTVTVTSVVDVYTTYCPGPTSFHMGGKDYVVTKPTTLIITDCPCTVTETHPAGPTWIPGHPGYKPGHPMKPEHPEMEKPGKPGYPVEPEHPEVEKPGKPGYPVEPEHPQVEKPTQPGHPEHPANPEMPEGEKPGKGEEVPEEPVVTAGAGAVQFGLGLAAFLGLMAL
ncbi:cell wall protein sed1 [Fusarium langsethiae]|uniref:Cell wall protein sed1 n=1 Tax=Fusarium langsethiae TaxID=179993 RepID=A0A0N0V8P2_FUSLA|nr:cell wall protein sed1 [Fusarium langsethiae]GKU00482.1 unnamed protein product [Fusarium langsethiae]GKU12995.1 unnamed protein product [Fusarium langsethiae]